MIHVCMASDPPNDIGEALTKLAEYQQEINKLDYSNQVDSVQTAWKQKSSLVPMLRFRELLKNMCTGDIRCMFCHDSCADEIEHFRPKSLYPEYVFDWANFLLACGKCNGPTYKGNKFSVYATDRSIIDVTRKRNAPLLKPPTGEPLLIHPRFEDPLDLLYLDLDSGTLQERDKNEKTIAHQRAKYTIKLLGLNEREELSGARRRVFGEHMDTLEKIVRLKAEGANAQEIESRKRRILKRGHGVVWEQMKRAAKRPDLLGLFTAVPEAYDW